MKRLLLLCCSGIILNVLLSSIALGAIWYVKTDGSDSNSGNSWYQAFATIQKAIDSASDGDEIWVAHGTYDISSAIDISGKDLAIYGGFVGTETYRTQRDWENNQTEISGYSVLIHDSSSVILDGLIITDGGGIRISYSTVTIRHCKITDNEAMDGGGIFVLSSDIQVIDSWIYNNRSLATGGGGIYVESGGMNFKIINSVVWGNSAVPYSGSGFGGGIYFNVISLGSTSPIITNCVIFGNHAHDGGGIYTNNDESVVPVITNTVIRNNLNGNGQPQQIAYSNYAPIVTYSNVEGGFSGSGNIDEDPLFVDPSNGDFHLSHNSPCIDKGFNQANRIPEEDFEGDDRIIDGDGDTNAIVDIGVDEYNNGGPIIVHNVPELTTWGTIIMMLLFCLVGLLQFRKTLPLAHK